MGGPRIAGLPPICRSLVPYGHLREGRHRDIDHQTLACCRRRHRAPDSAGYSATTRRSSGRSPAGRRPGPCSTWEACARPTSSNVLWRMLSAVDSRPSPRSSGSCANKGLMAGGELPPLGPCSRLGRGDTSPWQACWRYRSIGSSDRWPRILTASGSPRGSNNTSSRLRMAAGGPTSRSWTRRSRSKGTVSVGTPGARRGEGSAARPGVALARLGRAVCHER